MRPEDMTVFSAALAIPLGGLILWKRSFPAVLFALVAFSALFFSGAAVVMLTNAHPGWVLGAMHLAPDPGARAWGSGFMLFCLGFLLLRYGGASVRLALANRRVVAVAAACLALLLLGSVLQSTKSGLTDPLSALRFVRPFVLAWLLAAGWRCLGGQEALLDRLLGFAAAVTGISALVAFLELQRGIAYARFLLPDGTRVERAASLFFSPNVYALWCVGVAIFAGERWRRGAPPSVAAAALTFAGLGMLATATRAALVLYVAAAAAVLVQRILVRGERRALLAPPAIFLGTPLAVGLSASIGSRWTGPGAVDASAVLFGRMVGLPVEALHYVSQRVGGAPPANNDAFAITVQARVSGGTSVLGNNYLDNAYLVAYQSAGILGLLGLVGILCLFGWLALRMWRRPGGGLGLGICAACALSGLFNRSLEFFPLWVFISFGLAAVLTATLEPEQQPAAAAPAHPDRVERPPAASALAG